MTLWMGIESAFRASAREGGASFTGSLTSVPAASGSGVKLGRVVVGWQAAPVRPSNKGRARRTISPDAAECPVGARAPRARRAPRPLHRGGGALHFARAAPPA